VVLPWSTWATIATLRRSSLETRAITNILLMARDKSKEIRAIYEKPSEMRIGVSSLVG